MSRITISLAVGLLALLAAYGPAAAQATDDITVSVPPVNSSGVSGSARLTGSGPATDVELTMSRLEAGQAYSVRVHAGTCASPSASAAALPDLVAGPDGTASAGGALLFQGTEDVALSSVADGEHVIVVSLDDPVACGTIPTLSTYGTLLAGSIPMTGGFGLIVFGGGTYDELVTATGCALSSARFWVTVDGEFIILIPGTQVAPVNARFDALFGGAIPAGTTLLGACPAPSTGGSLPNGPSFGFVRAVGEQQLVVDPALFLSGEPALAAAREDGVIGPDEDLPNDFYIRNRKRDLIPVPVDDTASFTLIGFDESGGLQDVSVGFGQLFALLSGTADTAAYYSVIPGDFPMNLTVEDGVIVGGAQQYLP